MTTWMFVAVIAQAFIVTLQIWLLVVSNGKNPLIFVTLFVTTTMFALTILFAK